MAHDKYPQWLNLTGVTANGSAFVQAETRTPVITGSRLVMELLGVEWETNIAALSSAAAASADTAGTMLAQITDQTQTAIRPLANSRVVDKRVLGIQSQFAETTETGGAGFAYEEIRWNDFAAGGSGVLSAANSFFLAVAGDAAISTGDVNARILYRMVTVGAEELIGIIAQLNT